MSIPDLEHFLGEGLSIVVPVETNLPPSNPVYAGGITWVDAEEDLSRCLQTFPDEARKA
jgi:hypothetical protein